MTHQQVESRTMLTLARVIERVIFGGRARFAFLRWCLDGYFRSVRRRDWRWVAERPHFYDQRLNAWELLVGGGSPWGFSRAFHAGEVVRDGDLVLDVGCGDGFFASRFLAPRADRVDAIDIDERAISHARRYHPTHKVTFSLLNAVVDPFPGQQYDVIVWDGAVGHFSRSDADTVLEKMAQHLAPSGRFCGSESLGRDGEDHLQVFETDGELAELLRQHFPIVRTRTVTYTPPEGIKRTEVLWRCALNPAALDEFDWRSWSATR